MSLVAILCIIVAVLHLVGGLILAAAFSSEKGPSWLLPSAILGGLAGAALFLALAEIVTTLDHINERQNKKPR